MKPLSFLVLIAGLSVACSRNEINSMIGAPPTEIDEQELSSAGQHLCPAGESLVEKTGGVQDSMGRVAMPDVVAFVHARGRCALVEGLHEGGLVNWLSFTFNSDCLRNGRLWTPIREATSKGIAWRLSAVDGSSDHADIESNAEMPVSHIEKSTGMALFYCKSVPFAGDDSL